MEQIAELKYSLNERMSGALAAGNKGQFPPGAIETLNMDPSLVHHHKHHKHHHLGGGQPGVGIDVGRPRQQFDVGMLGIPGVTGDQDVSASGHKKKKHKKQHEKKENPFVTKVNYTPWVHRNLYCNSCKCLLFIF